jgi:hypothetical protein
MNVVLPLLRPGRDFRGVWGGIQILDRAGDYLKLNGAAVRLSESKGKASFCVQKEAKKLC